MRTEMNKDENLKAAVIESCINGTMTVKVAADRLNFSERYVKKLKARYKKYGASSMMHGNCGKQPKHTINADIKSELFLTIFWDGTPLHDGATIIQGDRVACAAAFYPPTNKELSPKYGARHRAAIGISEVTDSLTVIVSEETGTISFASGGELKKIPVNELRASLVNELNWFKTNPQGGSVDGQ